MRGVRGRFNGVKSSGLMPLYYAEAAKHRSTTGPGHYAIIKRGLAERALFSTQ